MPVGLGEISDMRNLGMAACAAMMLAGCAATKQEVIEQLGSQYIGKNVDVLVAQFGPPTATFKMNSGQTPYQWQLSNLSTARVSRACCFFPESGFPIGRISDSNSVLGDGGQHG